MPDCVLSEEAIIVYSRVFAVLATRCKGTFSMMQRCSPESGPLKCELSGGEVEQRWLSYRKLTVPASAILVCQMRSINYHENLRYAQFDLLVCS